MLNERLAIEQEKKQKDNRNRAFQEDEDEETMTYAVREDPGFINAENGSVFDIRKQGGINTAPSVFDRKAVFHTEGIG